MEEGVPAENGVFKKNRARIRPLKAVGPPVEMQPVLMRTEQAKRLHTDCRTRRKRIPIDEQRNPIVCAHECLPVPNP